MYGELRCTAAVEAECAKAPACVLSIHSASAEARAGAGEDRRRLPRDAAHRAPSGVAEVVRVMTVAARRRVARIHDELPTVLEFLSLCLAAGEPLLDSLRRVAGVSTGELVVELRAAVIERVRAWLPQSSAGRRWPQCCRHRLSTRGKARSARSSRELARTRSGCSSLLGRLASSAQPTLPKFPFDVALPRAA